MTVKKQSHRRLTYLQVRWKKFKVGESVILNDVNRALRRKLRQSCSTCVKGMDMKFSLILNKTALHIHRTA